MIRSIIHYFEQQLPGVPVKLCLIAGLLLHFSAAWFSEGFLHPDEHFQILEFANYAVGKSPASDLPWEFRSAMRPSLQPLLAAAAYRVTASAGIANPFFTVFILRLFTAMAAWLLTLALCVAGFRWLKHGFLKKIMFLFSCFFFYLPCLHCRFTSENLSGIIFFTGLLVIPFHDFADRNDGAPPRQKSKAFIAAGLLMGLAFFLRFQTGFAIAGLGAWLVAVRRAPAKELVFMAAAFCLMCLIAIGIDRWFYGFWVVTPWNYFRENILHGAAKNAGVFPWWYYFVELSGDLLPPLSVAILAAVILSCVKGFRNPLVWAAVPFFIAHCVISHKETRFLLPMLYALPPLLVLGADALQPPVYARLKKAASARPVKTVLWFIVVVNFILLAAFTFKPARETITVYKWFYHKCAARPLTVLTFNADPYSIVQLPVNFYRPPQFRLDTVHCAAELVLKARQAAEPLYVFIEGYYPSDSVRHDEALTWKVECRSIPTWMEHFNIGNWLSRVHVWTVFAVGRKNG